MYCYRNELLFLLILLMSELRRITHKMNKRTLFKVCECQIQLRLHINKIDKNSISFLIIPTSAHNKKNRIKQLSRRQLFLKSSNC